MQDVVRVSTSQVSDDDRVAIATYLKSLPAAPEEEIQSPDAQQMRTGEAVYIAHCAVCHTADTTSYPGLAGNSVVRTPDPTTLIHIILDGSQSAPIQGIPIHYSMPGFKTLTDDELAAVVTYIRNSWGNRFSPVSAKQAGNVRRLVAPRRYP
jgi:mono/diheme cytochrome c family protein